MTLSSQGTGTGPARSEAETAQELLSCLVGVAHAEVVGDPRGGIREVHVWSTGDSPTQQTVRNVESALRAHMDIALDRSRIRVMLGDPPAPSTPPPLAPDPSPSAPKSDGTTAAPRRRKSDQPEPPSGTSSPDPHHGAPAQPSSAMDTQEASPDTPRAISPPTSHKPWAKHSQPTPSAFPEPAVGNRIVYESYEILNHRSRESLLKVTLGWGQRRYVGQAHGTDDPMSAAESLAYATLQALEAMVRSRLRDSQFSLELTGIQFTDAFQYRLVVVVVDMRVRGEILPVSGSVVVQHGLGLAAILAVLQATDRRVRALLESLPEAPEPH